jgi:hypothetical protein
MRVKSFCPKCLRPTSAALEPAPAEVACACGVRRAVTMTESLTAKRIVDRCVFCASGYFYVEKNFNRWVGLGVLTAAILGFLWTITFNWFVAIGILLGAALLDMIAYAFAGDRTICYQCLAEYTGVVRNPDHGPYDLGTAGRFTDDYEHQREVHRK